MEDNKKSKYSVIVARGFKGLEQITIQLDTDNIDDLRDLVNKGAEAFTDRNAYYDAEQKKFEALMAEQQKAVDAAPNKKKKG